MSLPQTVPVAERPQQESLQLDARQRAMLEEMGVRLWWPQAVAAAPDTLAPNEAHPAAGAVSSQVAASVASAPVATDTAPAVSTQPAPAHTGNYRAQQAIDQYAQGAPRRAASRAEPQPQQTQRPAAHAQPQVQSRMQHQAHALLSGAPAPASAAQVTEGMRWLLVLDPPGLNEHAAGEPAAQADVRRLLLNMMAAVRLDAAQAYHFCAAQAVVAPGQMLDEAALGPWRASLAQEIQRLQPQLLLCLGRHAAYCVLGSQAPLGQLRGQVHRVAWLAAAADANAASATPVASMTANGVNMPVVVSYPPGYLLRNPAAKRQAWQDLCLAHALAQEALSAATAKSA